MASFRMQPDDKLILEKILYYRYLETRQIAGLLPHRSIQGLRRRLRNLMAEKLIERIPRHASFSTADAVFSIASRGLDYLNIDAETLPYSKLLYKAKPVYLNHSIFVNDIRCRFEESLENHKELSMHRWIPEYELLDFRASKKSNRFLLREDFIVQGKTYHFAPDACFVVSSSSNPDSSVLFCLEADRNTESITTVIRNKTVGFDCFQQSSMYEKYGCAAVRILFIVEGKSSRRIHNMFSILEGTPGLELIRSCPSQALEGTNIFDDPIWRRHTGQTVNLYAKSQ